MNTERGSARNKPTLTNTAARSKRNLQLIEIRKQDIDTHLQQVRRQNYRALDASPLPSEQIDYGQLTAQLSSGVEALQISALQELHRQLSVNTYTAEDVDELLRTPHILSLMLTLLCNCPLQPALCEAILLILLNLASSSSEQHIQALLDLHVDDLVLVQLHLITTHINGQPAPPLALCVVIENIFNTLGNLVAGNRTVRDKLIAGHAVGLVVDLLMQHTLDLSTVELGTWFISNMLRVGGISTWEPFQPALRLFAGILERQALPNTTELVSQALWGLCFILQIGSFTASPVLEACAPALLVSCLGIDREHPVITAALRAMALLSAGPSEIMEQLLAAGLFGRLAHLAEQGRPATVRTTYFVLSNIVLNSPREVQLLLDHESLRDKLISDAMQAPFDIAAEAMTVLAQAISTASSAQLDRLEFSGVLPIFVDMCYASSSDVVRRALEALIHYTASDASRILSRDREIRKYEATAVDIMLAAGIERALDVLEESDHRELAAMASHLHDLLSAFVEDDAMPDMMTEPPRSLDDETIIWNGTAPQAGIQSAPPIWDSLNRWSLPSVFENKPPTYEEY